MQGDHVRARFIYRVHRCAIGGATSVGAPLSLSREVSLEHIGVVLEQVLSVLQYLQENFGVLRSVTAGRSQVAGNCLLPGNQLFASCNVICGNLQFLRMTLACCVGHGVRSLYLQAGAQTVSQPPARTGVASAGDHGQRRRSGGCSEQSHGGRPRTMAGRERIWPQVRFGSEASDRRAAGGQSASAVPDSGHARPDISTSASADGRHRRKPEGWDVQDRIRRRQLQFALAFSAATDCAASARSLP